MADVTEVKIEIPFGYDILRFYVPQKNLMGIIEPLRVEKNPDEEEEIRRALREPVGAKRLSELAMNAKSAAILVSDITRPCPSYKFLPFLLNELGEIDPKDIAVIFGLGIHRKHLTQEQIKLIGEDIFNKVKVLDFDESSCVSLGYTSRGTPIEIFRLFLESDLRICTGNIEYHYFAGYSGGSKPVMPGISSRKSIEHNHSMMLHPQASAGVIDGNPVREDIDEVGKIAGIDFILNVIINEKKEIVSAVAGDYLAAFEEGVKIYDEIYRVDVEEPADIVITSPGGCPKDINLYQAQKALDNAKDVVKDGGVIILVASCDEGLGDEVFKKWMSDMITPDLLIERIKNKFVLGGHKAAAIANLKKRAEIYLISKLNYDFVKKIGLNPAKSIDEALSKAFNKMGSGSRVLVVPYGQVVRIS